MKSRLCLTTIGLTLCLLLMGTVAMTFLTFDREGDALLIPFRSGLVMALGASFVAIPLLIGTLFIRQITSLRSIFSTLDASSTIVDPKLLKARNEFGHLSRTINTLAQELERSKQTIATSDEAKEALIEGLEDGVMVLDAHLTVKMANRRCARIVKVPKDQLHSSHFSALAEKIAAPLWQKCSVLLKKVMETQTVMLETFHTEGGGKAHIDIRVTPLPHNSGVVLVFRDRSSDYKILEMGRDFIGNASHELRTPITIIKGFAETLHDMPEISGAMLEDITEKIVRNCQRMNALVKNLLLLADLDSASKARVQSCELVSLVGNCNQTLLALHPSAIIETLHNKEEIIYEADPELLELAITNLLQNGAKYSNDDPEMKVTIEEKESEVLISISDKGIGIPSKDLPYIFDRFYTVNKAHARRLGGAGLGLSIVKRIVQQHEGEIHASSVLGQGTTFSILLPKLN